MEQTEKQREYLRGAFQCAPPDEWKLWDLEQRLMRYERIKEELQDETEYVSRSFVAKRPNTKRTAIRVVGCIIIILLTIITIYMMETNYMASVGLTLVVVFGGYGTAFLDFCGVFGGNMIEEEHVEMVKNPVWVRKNEEKTSLENSLKKDLENYGYFSGKGLAYDFIRLRRDSEEYRRYFEE